MAKTSKDPNFWQNFEIPEEFRTPFRKDVVAKVKRKLLHRDKPADVPLRSKEVQAYASQILTSDFINKYQPRGYSAGDMGEYSTTDYESLEESLSKMIAIWMEETRKKQRSRDPTYTPTGQSKLDKSFPLIDKHVETSRSASMRKTKVNVVGNDLDTREPGVVDRPEDQLIDESNHTEAAEGSNARGRRERSPTDIEYAEDEELPGLSEILTTSAGVSREQLVPLDAVQGTEGTENMSTNNAAVVQSMNPLQNTRNRKRRRSEYSIVSTESESSRSDSNSDIDRPSSRKRAGGMRAIEDSHERARSETITGDVPRYVEGSTEERSVRMEHETVRSISLLAGVPVSTPTILLNEERNTTVPDNKMVSEFGEDLLKYFGVCRYRALETANQLQDSNFQSIQSHHDAALLDHICRDIESRMLARAEVGEEARRAHQITSFTLYR